MPMFILFNVPIISPQLVIVENHRIETLPFINFSNYQFSVQNYIYMLYGKKNYLAFILTNCHVDIFPHIKN